MPELINAEMIRKLGRLSVFLEYVPKDWTGTLAELLAKGTIPSDARVRIACHALPLTEAHRFSRWCEDRQIRYSSNFPFDAEHACMAAADAAEARAAYVARSKAARDAEAWRAAGRCPDVAARVARAEARSDAAADRAADSIAFEHKAQLEYLLERIREAEADEDAAREIRAVRNHGGGR